MFVSFLLIVVFLCCHCLDVCQFIYGCMDDGQGNDFNGDGLPALNYDATAKSSFDLAGYFSGINTIYSALYCVYHYLLELETTTARFSVYWYNCRKRCKNFVVVVFLQVLCCHRKQSLQDCGVNIS